MSYVIIFILLWPFKMLMKPFHQGKGRNLVIQTAKIGDFVNITPLLKHLKKSDVLISKTVLPLAGRDTTIESIFLIEEHKKSLFSKIRLAFRLLNRYDNVYLLQPNSINAFYAAFCNAKHKAFLETYVRKWYHRMFFATANVVRQHGKYDLALENYLKLADPALTADSYHSHATLPLWIPKTHYPVLDKTGEIKIGISISAGNRAKTIPREVWQQIIQNLSNLDCQFIVFGPANEQPYLDALLEILSEEEKSRVVSLIGQMPLEDVPFALGQLDAYIASDSGNAYIADSQKTPIICFTGPCCKEEQRPLGKVLFIEPENFEPASFVFETRTRFSLTPEQLFALNEHKLKAIHEFITDSRGQERHYG